MKLLTSYYSPTSSPPLTSSTLSLDTTLCSSKSAGAGCITTILHRILCSGGGLQTHPIPSDQIRELDSNFIASGKVQELKANTSVAASSPGIVARLMGLDSMAEKEIPSLSRSRSLNSVDYLGECKRMEGQYRRVKSSSSFRDLPAFHLHENENFLVFSFESGGESKEFKSRRRRKENGGSPQRGGLKKNKREKVHDHETMKRKEVSNGEKVKRRKKGKTCCTEKKVESDCGSEDSSPVSVFDFEREALGTEVDSFGVGMSWRRKLSPELENDQLFILHANNSDLMDEERNVEANENNVHEGSKKKEKQSKECVDIWGEICRLVEDELVGSNQLQEVKRKQGDFESISADFESEIFNHLLDELIDELVGNPLKALQI